MLKLELNDKNMIPEEKAEEIKQEKEGNQSGFGQEDSLERKRVFGEFRFRFLAFQLNRRIFAGIFSVSVFFV